MFCNLCSPDMVSIPVEIKTAYKINQTKYHQVNTLLLSFDGTVKSLRKHCLTPHFNILKVNKYTELFIINF